MSKTILNTRPILQAKQTAEIFRKHGFHVLDFPCIEIVSIDDPINIGTKLALIDNNKVIVFTSQNSVEFAFKIKPEWTLPKSATVISVGIKTAKALEKHRFFDSMVPKQQSSQGVIDLLKQIKKPYAIILISANNGRNEIQNYAKSNKIDCEQINVYKRQIPIVNNNTLNLIKNSKDLIVLATSVTTLVNLKKLLNHNLWQKILTCKLACASERIQQFAIRLEFKDTVNIDSANSDIMAEKLL